MNLLEEKSMLKPKHFNVDFSSKKFINFELLSLYTYEICLTGKVQFNGSMINLFQVQ